MACACKISQKADYITQKYGIGGPVQKTTHMSGDIMDFFEQFFVGLLTILATPFLFFYIIGKIIFSGEKTLRISDLIPFK